MNQTSKKPATIGAQGYLVKPEGIAELVEEVAKLIAEAKTACPDAVDLPE